MAKYICIEGTEGLGKSTQIKNLVKHFEKMGKNVISTVELGSPLVPLALECRKLALDNSYSDQHSLISREFITQASRSSHYKKVVLPNLDKEDTVIIQDRGVLSGLAYGENCGLDLKIVEALASFSFSEFSVNPYSLYDHLILLTGDVEKGMLRAKKAKQEFSAGDAMELKGLEFMLNVSKSLEFQSSKFNNLLKVNTDEKNIDQVFSSILKSMES